MRASHSTTRLHTTERLPVLLRAALALAASALALCVATGCAGKFESTFYICDSCSSTYNGGHVNQASCGHWFCDQKSNCKAQRDAHEALAEGAPSLDCGEEKHYRCDGVDHSVGACGAEGHFGCDGVNHSPAYCGIAGHHLCDDGLHAEGRCGISGHWACNGADHTGAACSVDGHLACDGLNHATADCGVGGHFACDGAKHSEETCSGDSQEASESPMATSGNAQSVSHSHYGGTATCLARATCVGCDQPYGAANPANHDAACSFTEAAPCAHKTHDEACGYAEAVEASGCTHECTTESGCVQWGYAPGGGSSHDSTCTGGFYKCDSCGNVNCNCPNTFDRSFVWVPCDCGYSSGNSYSYTSCTHAQHDAECGFAEAAEAVPCKHAEGSHDETCGYAPGTPCSAT